MVESKMIKGFPNYVINSDGTVMNIKTGKYLKPEITKNGYARVTLSAFGKTKKYLLHRLIAELFVEGRSSDKNYVDHKDNNKLNNKSFNLQWVTPKENSIKAVNDGLYGMCENHSNSKYSNELVKNMYLDYKLNNLTRKEIMLKYNVPKSLCDDVLYKKHWLSLTDKLDEEFNI